MRFGPAPVQPPAPTVHHVPLLDALLRESLDPAYADATARRLAAEASGVGTPVRPNGHWLAVVGVGLVAIVAGLAIGQQRASAPDAAKARVTLIREINNRTDLVTFLTRAADTLRADTAARRDALFADTQAGMDLAGEIRTLDEVTGATVITGAGLVVKMSDAPKGTRSADGSTASGGEGQILDRDIQDVVNALWASGARGIAINGIRLTAQTAIRTAGEAILVDTQPQSSPYVIQAVGAVENFQSAFPASAVAQRFDAWRQLYGLGFDIAHSKTVSLPAAAPTAPHHATALAPLPSKDAGTRSETSSPPASTTPSASATP